MEYFKKLDFLRFFAVALVVMQHWFKLGTAIGLDLGRIGVLIFFTLSGFLITRILLSEREQLDNGKQSLVELLRTFYIRRSLRIFPIYFLLLFFLYFLPNDTDLNFKLPWYVMYASNIYTFLNQSWDGLIGPLWSLAVEEQFYLFWPLAILLIPMKRLKLFLTICLVLGPVFRFISIVISRYFFSSYDDSISAIVMMPSCIDCFAWGGLLSLYKSSNKSFELNWKLVISDKLFYVVSLLVLIFIFLPTNSLILILYPTFISIFSVLWINKLVSTNNSKLGYVFEWPIFLFIGKISYGIYLYHGPFPIIMGYVDYFLQKIDPRISIYESLVRYSDNVRLLIWIFYLLVICILSYYFIERPLNNLKSRFKYMKN